MAGVVGTKLHATACVNVAAAIADYLPGAVCTPGSLSGIALIVNGAFGSPADRWSSRVLTTDSSHRTFTAFADQLRNSLADGFLPGDDRVILVFDRLDLARGTGGGCADGQRHRSEACR